MPQLILGLLICFISFGLYMMFSPYLEDKHDYVSQICQLQIFFALLSGVVFNAGPSESEADLFGLILMCLQAVPIASTAFLSSSLSKHVLEPEKRKKLFSILNKLQKKLLPRLQLLSAKLRRVGKFSKSGSATMVGLEVADTSDAITSSKPMSTENALIAWKLRKRLQANPNWLNGKTRVQPRMQMASVAKSTADGPSTPDSASGSASGCATVAATEPDEASNRVLTIVTAPAEPPTPRTSA